MPLTLSRGDRTVTFADNLPTVIIGERINPTGRKKLQAALLAGDLSIVAADARAQAEAGAHMLDVNVGVAGGDEPRLLLQALEVAMQASDLPLCIDTANTEALAGALAHYPGKALVNSTTGEEAKLERVLPLVAQHKAAVIGLCMDDKGIPTTAAERVAVARKIVQRARSYGIPAEDVVIDCLCLTCATESTAVRTTLDAIRRVRDELGVNLTLGVSNVSFGLPDRLSLNVSMLTMALAAGVTCPIIDPTIPAVRNAVLSADALLGRDEWATNWITAFRKQQAAP